MAVTDVTPEISYTKDGSAGTVHPIPFRLLQASHLTMYVDGAFSTDGFTVAGTLPDAATVTTTQDYTDGTIVTFVRNVPYSQESDFVAGEATPAQRIEDMGDLAVMQIQQLKAQLDRISKAAPGETPPGGSFKQSPNTTFGQDSSGNVISRTAAEQRAHLEISNPSDVTTKLDFGAAQTLTAGQKTQLAANLSGVLVETAVATLPTLTTFQDEEIIVYNSSGIPVGKVPISTFGTLVDEATSIADVTSDAVFLAISGDWNDSTNTLVSRVTGDDITSSTDPTNPALESDGLAFTNANGGRNALLKSTNPLLPETTDWYFAVSVKLSDDGQVYFLSQRPELGTPNGRMQLRKQTSSIHFEINNLGSSLRVDLEAAVVSGTNQQYDIIVSRTGDDYELDVNGTTDTVNAAGLVLQDTFNIGGILGNNAADFTLRKLGVYTGTISAERKTALKSWLSS